MIPYIGDFAEDATIYHYFNTFDSNDPAASVTITNLADTDIYVYKDGSVTDIVTDGATVVIDFDSRTGVHKLTIDTSVHADYAVGSDYMVLIEGTTVDAGTVTAGIFTFSIENRYNDVNVVSVSGTTQTAGDIPALVTTVDTVADGIQTDLDNATDGLGALKTLIDALPAATDIVSSGAITTSGGAVSTVTTVTTTTTNTDMLTAAAVNAEVDTALADAGLDHLISASVTGTDIADDSIIAQLVSASATADWDDFDNTTDALQAIRDRGDSAWTTGAGGSDRLLLVDTTIATLSTQTSFTLTAGSADDDAYNNCTIVVEDVSTSTQKSIGMVLDYTGSTKTVTLKEALAFTIATTDKVYILAENSLKSTVANRQLDVTATGAAGIDWANVENPTTALDLSGTDIQLVDTVTTYTGNTVQTGDAFARLGAPAGADVSADIAAAQTDLDTLTAGVTLAAGAITDASLAGNMEIVFETDFATNYNATRNAWATNVQDFVGTTAADPFSAQVVAASMTGHTVQTGDTYALANGATGFVAIDTVVDSILALLDDARTEPGQGAPPVNPDLATKIDYLYKAWRNKTEQTATTMSLYDDAGSTVDQKSTVSDDGTTATRGEMATGP